MICLDNTDVIEGGASVDDVVDYTIHGLVGTTFTQLAAGVLSDVLTAALYTAGAAVSVVNITLVNTHSAAVDITLRLDPADAGNPRYIIPETISLGIGYSLHTDGTKITVMDASGNIQTLPGLHGSLHKAGAADELLNDPGPIGGDTPAAGAFTTISASGLITATGGQIAFPADAVPSADANTLDDYEEGTHEVVITCNVSGGYTMATNKTIAYRKIGDLVHLQGQLVITSEDTPNGYLYFSIPFTSIAGLTQNAGYLVGSVALYDHGGTLANGVCARITSALDRFSLFQIADNGTDTTLDEANVDTSFSMYIGFSYIAG